MEWRWAKSFSKAMSSPERWANAGSSKEGAHRYTHTHTHIITKEDKCKKQKE